MAETEDEQIEALKQFFKRYGNTILTVLIIVLGSYTGYQYWQKSQSSAHETASLYYNQLVQLATVDDKTVAQKEQFNQLFAKLSEDYPKSRYSAYAALLKAKLAVEAGELDKAQQSLEWVAQHNKEQDIRALLNLRLARLHLAQGHYDKALALLNDEGNAFAPLYEELKGDIYLNQDKKDQALAAYEKAKQLLESVPQSDTRLLEMKIDSLKANNKGTILPLTEGKSA